MTRLESLVALISIIVGLGLTDLAQSFRELIRPAHRVRWDGLPLAWSAFVFLLTIVLWWNGFSLLKGTGETGLVFLLYLLIFFLLYLCCAFALPDPDWEEPSGSSQPADPSPQSLDLEAFYFSKEHRRWFFGLLIGVIVLLGAVNQVTGEWPSVTARLSSALIVGGLAALGAVPIGTDRRWAHWIAVAVATGLIGWNTIVKIVL